jgi:hypothetical protein
MSQKTMVYGAQHNPWSMDGNEGVTSLLFIEAKGNKDQGMVGLCPTPVKAETELTKALTALHPTPFPCLCEVEFEMVANRKGMQVTYTRCTPVVAGK